MLCPEENENGTGEGNVAFNATPHSFLQNRICSTHNGAAPMCRFTIKNEPDDIEQFGIKQEKEGIVQSPNLVSHAESKMMHGINVKKEIIVKTEDTSDERYEKVAKEPNITDLAIRDIKGNSKRIWYAGANVDVEEEYLVRETIKPEPDQYEMKVEEACNLTLGEVPMTSSCEGLGCNMNCKQQVTLEPQHRENIFKCGVCGKSFLKKYELIIHKRTHTGNKTFQCEVCKKTFAWKLSFTRHKRIHTREKLFECAVCKKSFIQRSHLTRHQLIHT